MTSLTQDLRLLDTLDAACQEVAPSQVRERLVELCGIHQLNVPDAQIDRAVALYVGHPEPSAPVEPFTLWKRAASKEEWETVIASMQAYKDRSRDYDENEALWCMSFIALAVIGNIVGVCLSDLNAHQKIALCTFGSVLVAMGSGAIIASLSVVWNKWGLGRLRRHWNKEGVAQRDLWTHPDFKSPSTERQPSKRHAPLHQMAEAPRDVEKLKGWRAVPEALLALRQIVRSDAPITRRDAFELDRLVKAHQDKEAQKRQQAQDEQWRQDLEALVKEDL